MKKFLLSMMSAAALVFSAQAADTYKPLTNVSEIGDGVDCIIVGKLGDDVYAMKTNGTSGRSAGTVTPESGMITPEDVTQILRLEPSSSVSGSYIFRVYENGSLTLKTLKGGTASKNGLSIATNGLPTAAGSQTWSVTVATDGTTDVVAQLTNGRNTMQLNPNNNSPMFSCYKEANSQYSPVTVYVKYDAATQTKTLAPTFEGFGATGTYWSATNVKLNLEEGADAWYTTDGTDPTEQSTAYTAAGIDVPAATEDGQTFVIKAIAKKGTLELSDVATLTLTAQKQYRLVKYNTVVPGAKYRWVVKDGETYKASTNCGASNNYYLLAETVTVADDAFESALADNYLVFEDRGEGKYAIKQADGQYLYMDDSHFSFNKNATFDAANNNYLWTVTEEADGTVKIANVGRTYTANEVTAGLFAQFQSNYNTFSVYNPDKTAGILPALYINEEEKPVAPSYPETLYAMGNFKGATMSATTGIALTKEGSKFTGEVEIVDSGDSFGWWMLAEKTGTAWSEIGASYGPATTGTEVAAPSTFDFTVRTGEDLKMSKLGFWKTAPGKYTLTVDFDNNKVTLASAAVELTDPKLKFNEEQPVNMKAMTEYRTISPAVAEAEGFDGTINYSIEDMEGNTLTEGYSMMIAESGENLRFMAAGDYLLVASTEATDKWAAGRATLKIKVVKSSVTLTFNASSYSGVVGKPVKGLEAVNVNPLTYDGTLNYSLSGTGLTADDYTIQMEDDVPVLTVNKAGTWTLTVMAPATDAFLGDRISAQVTISEKSDAPEDPVVTVGTHVMDANVTWRSQNMVKAEMTCETEDAKIYWSYKPANENEGSAFVEYTEPVEIAVDGTLTVYAELNGIKSEAKSYGFIIESSVAMTVADAEGLEMYTLDGIRVRHPEAGRVYVVIADGRAYRVILK